MSGGSQCSSRPISGGQIPLKRSGKCERSLCLRARKKKKKQRRIALVVVVVVVRERATFPRKINDSGSPVY